MTLPLPNGRRRDARIAYMKYEIRDKEFKRDLGSVRKKMPVPVLILVRVFYGRLQKKGGLSARQSLQSGL